MDLPSLKSVVLPGCLWEFEMSNADRMQLASLCRSIQDYQVHIPCLYDIVPHIAESNDERVPLSDHQVQLLV